MPNLEQLPASAANGRARLADHAISQPVQSGHCRRGGCPVEDLGALRQLVVRDQVGMSHGLFVEGAWPPALDQLGPHPGEVDLDRQRGPDAYAESLRQKALDAARLNVENRAVIARRVVAFGHFQLVRALFRRARITVFWAFAMVALGVGLFVAGTVVDSGGSGDTVANLGYPASVRLAFSDEGRKQLQDRLSAACMRQPVPAYLFAGDWVVTTQGTGCRSVAFRWTQSLGTIRLP
jgi:hypothetical protein